MTMGGRPDFDIVEELEATGALEKGHFKLSSGLHSDTYIQCSQLLKHPDAALQAGRAIAEEAPADVDLVFSPALGALIIGFTAATALGVQMVFAERAGGRMELRRGFRIEPGTRVLLVEDVITTGGSIMELARIVEAAGAQVAALACIVDRSGVREQVPYPHISLLRMEVASYQPENCPLCANGVPVDAPGSRYSS